MKKLFVIAAIFVASLVVISCGSGSKQSEEVVVHSTAVEVVEEIPVDSTAVDTTVVQ